MNPIRAQVYLDTNIFILLKEGTGDVPAHLVDLIASSPVASGPGLGTSELTLAELLAKPYAEGRDELIDQYDGWIRPSGWLEVGPVTREVLWYAAVLRSRYRSIKLPDAIHLSTAFGLSCRYFLTTDTGLKGTYSIAHTRYGLSRFSPEIEILRPEPEVLRELKADLTKV